MYIYGIIALRFGMTRRCSEDEPYCSKGKNIEYSKLQYNICLLCHSFTINYHLCLTSSFKKKTPEPPLYCSEFLR